MDNHELTTEVLAHGIVDIDEDRSSQSGHETAFLNEFMGGADTSNTSSGQRVNSVNAISYAPVWSAVQLLSGDVSKLPLALCRRTDPATGGKDILFDHPLTDLVDKRPNSDLNAQKFWQRTMTHLLLWGNAYIWIKRDGPNGTGEVRELINLLPNQTTIQNLPSKTNPNGEIRYRAQTFGGSQSLLLHPFDVIALEGLQDVVWANGAGGINTIQALRDAVGLGLAQEDYSGEFFDSGGRVGGILELPAAMSKKGRDNVEQGFAKTYETARNAFKTVILRDGAKFHAAQVAAKDTQLSDATEQQVRQVARIFGIPPSLLGVSGPTSYGEKADDASFYLDRSLSYWLNKITSELDFKLLTVPQQRSQFFAYDTKRLTRPGIVPLMNAISVGLGSGAITQNEGRFFLELAPIEGGDEVKDINAAPAASEPLADEDPAPDDDEGADEDREFYPDKSERVQQAAGGPVTYSQGELGSNRVVYAMTENARERASAGRLERWLKGDLPNHREKAFALLGDESLIDEFIGMIRGLDTLEAIDRACTLFEARHHADQASTTQLVAADDPA